MVRALALTALALLTLLTSLPLAAQAPREVTGPEISTLIRTTVVAVHHANLTGNYTVLRDLGAPAFRQANTATGLAQIFTPLRISGVDLGPTVLFDPVMTARPGIDEDGLLRLTGYFPTTPVRVMFDLGFQFAEERWSLFVVSLDTQAAQAPPAPAPGASKPSESPAKPAAAKPPESPPKPAAAKPAPAPKPRPRTPPASAPKPPEPPDDPPPAVPERPPPSPLPEPRT